MSFPSPNQPDSQAGGMPDMGMGAPMQGPMPMQDPELEALTAQLIPPPSAVDWTVRMSVERQNALAKRVCAEISHYRQGSERRIGNAREWRRAARMMPDVPLSEDEPDDWHSNSRVPFTREACQSHETKLNGQICDADPPFAVVARKPMVLVQGQPVPLSDLLPQIGDALAAKLEEADWKQCAREVHGELPVVSPCAVRVTWKTETRRKPMVETEHDTEGALLMMEAGVDPTEAWTAGLETGPDGKAKVSPSFEDETCYEGLELACIPYERLLLLPGTAKKKKDLWGIGELVTLRGMELKQGAKDGVYLKKPVQELLKLPGDALTEEDLENQDLEGLDASMATANDDTLYDNYECAEVCWLDDLNKDGRMEWYIVGVHLAGERLIRCQYMPYEHGRPYYVPFSYIRNTLVGESIAELVALLQETATRVLNDFVDLTRLSTAFGSTLLVDGTSGLDPDNDVIVPGMFLYCDNVNGVKPVEFASNIPAVLQQLMGLMELLRNWKDTLTASSNPILGRETETQKTLGEVTAVLQQANQIFEDYAEHVALQWAEVWDLARYLCAQFADKGSVNYRKVASEGPIFASIPKEVLLADIDLVPAGLNAFADQQQRLQRDLMLIQTFGQHPLTANDWQLQAKLLGALAQDAKAPDWQGMQGALLARAEQMAMQEALMFKAQMMQGAAAQAQQQGDSKRADEAHQSDMTGRDLQQAGQVKELMAPPERPNGKAKK